MVEMLSNQGPWLEFDMTEIALFNSDIVDVHLICTVPHDLGQETTFMTLRALEDEVIDIIMVGLEVGIVERDKCPYRNPWVLACKKAAGRCVVKSFVNGNGYMLVNAALPPCVDEFSENLASMSIVSIIDLLSGYYLVELAEKSRDTTAV